MNRLIKDLYKKNPRSFKRGFFLFFIHFSFLFLPTQRGDVFRLS